MNWTLMKTPPPINVPVVVLIFSTTKYGPVIQWDVFQLVEIEGDKLWWEDDQGSKFRLAGKGMVFPAWQAIELPTLDEARRMMEDNNV